MLAAWIGFQRAVWGQWLEAARTDTGQGSTPRGLLHAQAEFVRTWAQTVAADPRASKIEVEAAHQMYDLVMACTEAKAATYDAWFAALRSMGQSPFTDSWNELFTAWQSAIVRTASDGRSVSVSDKELTPPAIGPR